MTGTITSETELIQTYLAPLASSKGALGLKDDAGYFTPPPGADIVVTTDPVISGVHFLASERADDIAWKALAVNISDLVAKGAVPLAYTMALAFPEAPSHEFMRVFARGLADAQASFGCTLIGGDTDKTKGPLSISITAFGAVPGGRIVQRTTAAIGDEIFVTGTLGDAALGLMLHEKPEAISGGLTDGDKGFLMARYLRPEPRLELAPLLRAYASAALDISDGLAKDLQRLAWGAGGQARAVFSSLPLSPSAKLVVLADPAQKAAVIAGGDDYEILFTVPPSLADDLRHDTAHLAFKVTHIGTLVPGEGVMLTETDGTSVSLGRGGWDHFD